jgi:hypothetical protein
MPNFRETNHFFFFFAILAGAPQRVRPEEGSQVVRTKRRRFNRRFQFVRSFSLNAKFVFLETHLETGGVSLAPEPEGYLFLFISLQPISFFSLMFSGIFLGRPEQVD